MMRMMENLQTGVVMMKKIFIVFAAVFLCAAGYGQDQTKELKILMIGNSFSVSVANDLHQIVRAAPDCKMTLVSAYIGGCTLNGHWKNIEKAEQDPKHQQYWVSVWKSDAPKGVSRTKGSVNQLLKQKWDIVTIQQGSHESWDLKFYEPAVEKLIAYIRKNAPDAEIVLQQTWAYRIDDARLRSWKLTQTEMYEKLNHAYTTIAEKYQLRMIPVGNAVQIARKALNIQSTAPAADQLPSKLKHPDLPSFNNDIVGQSHWTQNKKTQTMVMKTDPFHLNDRGKYLQACVWFSYLFGKNAEEIKYIPPYIEAEYAASLQKFAREAVDAASAKNVAK